MSKQMALWAIKEAPIMYPDLSSGACHLLIHLADFYNEDKRQAWPSVETLSRLMHVSKQSVRNYMKELMAAGLVVKRFRKNETNTYRIRQITPIEMAIAGVKNLEGGVKDLDLWGQESVPLEVKDFDPNNNKLQMNSDDDETNQQTDDSISAIIHELKRVL